MSKYDFGGWATKPDLRCKDGRTIRRDAFAHQDGEQVPLVWQHQHGAVGAVLGHAILKARDGGIYAYGFLNGTQAGKDAKECIAHGDVTRLSIWANDLEQTNTGDVCHGNIREVSLVLAGANPGAVIDFPTLAHSDELVMTEARISTGEYLEHGGDLDDGNEPPKGDPEPAPAADPTPAPAADPEPAGDPAPTGDTVAHSDTQGNTYKKVYDNMTPEQKDTVDFLVGQALAQTAGGDTADHSDKGGTVMHTNVFDQTNPETQTDVLTHDQMTTILKDAKRCGSLKESFLSHAQDYGIENIEYLFPDARQVGREPDFIARDMDWVTDVMNSTHHIPFSRFKSVHADITGAQARALGYIKGKIKKEEVFSLLKRTTTPQTIYKKQKLDRDDIVDIVDFNVVAWLKTEMRMMLNEEIARAILIGDGRLQDSDDKISEEHVRPIATDTNLNLYAINVDITVDASATEDDIAKATIRAAIKARKNYKGSGNPVFYTTEDCLTSMLLLEDELGHALYKTEQELATKLRVRKIVTVPVMEGYTFANGMALQGIIVNLTDYTVGADKGGAVSMFEDFDIDYNQEKYLIETRISGALTKPKSALVLRLNTGAAAPSEPTEPTEPDDETPDDGE